MTLSLALFRPVGRFEPLRRAVVILSLLGMGFASGNCWEQSREFHWRGSTLAQWAHEMTAHPVQNRKFVHQLGPALVPYLIQEIDDVDGLTDGTFVFQCICVAYSAAPRFVRPWLPEPVLQSERRLNAVTLLGDMGPDASAAVPTLCRLLDDESVAGSALASLRSIGLAAKSAVPRVRGLLAEPRPFVLTTLLQIGAEESELRPLLTRAETTGPCWLRAEARAVSVEMERRETVSFCRLAPDQ